MENLTQSTFTNEDIQRLGFNYAATTNGDANSTSLGLNTMYDSFLQDQKRQVKNKIQSLAEQIKNKTDENTQFNANIQANTDEIKNIENQIQQIDKSGGSHKQKHMISFVIGTFITILLTFFVILFYSSTAFIIFENTTKINRVFLPEAFSLASNLEGSSIIFTFMILFPILFLGLGFLIHTFLEKKKYIPICIFLLLTLIADCMVGIKITERIYETLYSTEIKRGIMSHFEISNAFINQDFYLFLLLGFVVYVIWGFLLHYILTHPYLETDFSIKNRLLKEITKLTKQNRQLQALIEKNQNNIIFMKEQLEELKSMTTIPIDVSSLQSWVGTWMSGWQSYIHGSFAIDDVEHRIKPALEKQKIWLEEKINNLKNIVITIANNTKKNN